MTDGYRDRIPPEVERRSAEIAWQRHAPRDQHATDELDVVIAVEDEATAKLAGVTLAIARASARARFPWAPVELDFAFPAPAPLEIRAPFLATRCEVASVRKRLLRGTG